MLLLFDIDGTLLLGASSAHAQALHGALRNVHGIEVGAIGSHPTQSGGPTLATMWPPKSPPSAVRPSADAAGRTDGEIARIVLLDAGVSAERIDELADDVRAECCRLYAELCPPDLSDKIVRGIPEVLDWLATRDDVRLSLLTGNFEPVARLKLKRAGLCERFPPGQGAFGSDSEDRTMLPAIARRRAGAVDGKAGTSYPRQQTIVIGDTPRDIACARADGVRCVAVCTGPYDASASSEAS